MTNSNMSFGELLAAIFCGFMIGSFIFMSLSISKATIANCHASFAESTSQADSLQVMLDNGQCKLYAEVIHGVSK